MHFEDLLTKLKGLFETKTIHTSYHLGKERAFLNEVLIGIGNEESGGVILNNKIEKKYISVTDYMMNLPDERFSQWRNSLQNPEQPEAAHYFLEDLSADTCLSFILFYARLYQVPTSEIPNEWILYTNRWKRGDVKTTGVPLKSWGALLNALSHDYYEYNGKNFNPAKIQDGFKRCMLFTIELLLGGHKPSNVPELHESDVYHRATAILHIEEQEYLHVLNSAQKIQLELPLRDSERRVLIDALIVTQMNPLGTLKNFSRNDIDNPYFKSGFGLLALHHPTYSGTGDDMSVSVDPLTGTHLEELWHELEDLENSRWGSERPIHPQRKGYDFNQPWFNGYGSTLIGAPKFITLENEEDPEKPIVTTQLGSKLNWNDVLTALWKLYNPANLLQVQIYENGKWSHDAVAVSQLDLTAQKEKKRFIALKPDFSSKSNYIFTPTFQSYLVALLINGKSVGLDELPPEKSFKFLEVPGGFALIHEQGVVFLDDWTKEDSDLEVYINEFNLLIQRYIAMNELKSRINVEIKSLVQKIDSKKEIRKQFLQLSDSLAKLKMELRTVITDTISSSKDYHLQIFREEVERHWGLNTQLDDLYQTVQEVEETLKNMVETRTNRVLNTITIMGLPIALFGGIFQEPLKDLFIRGNPNWTSLGLFAGLTLIAITTFQSWIDKE